MDLFNQCFSNAFILDMEHQDALPSYSVSNSQKGFIYFYLFIHLFCANTHNSSGLICCSFPLASAFPFFPTNGLNGSGSQSATPVGGKITTLLLLNCSSSFFFFYLFNCLSSVALTSPSLTCTQKVHLALWLRHAGICSHRLLTAKIMLNTLLWEPCVSALLCVPGCCLKIEETIFLSNYQLLHICKFTSQKALKYQTITIYSFRCVYLSLSINTVCRNTLFMC